LIARKACLIKGALISDLINEMSPNSDSDTKRVWKCAVILKNLNLDMVSTISAWLPVHVSVRIHRYNYHSTCT